MGRLTSTVLRWIDSESPSTFSSTGIDWFRVLPFILIHLGCLLVFWVGFSAFALYSALFLYCVRIFCIGAVYHRYYSHKAFKLNRFYQFLFTTLTMTAMQRGPLWWAAHHRVHHLASDQPSDPHSPVHHGFWWSHLGWFLSKDNFTYDKSRVKDFIKYPEIVFLNRFDALVPILFGCILYLLGYYLEQEYPVLQTSGSQMLIWGFCLSTVAVYHATFSINSIGHEKGTQPHKTDDHSRNNILLALLTFGEGWHNNHHQYPVSARQGFKWWEIDVTYYILYLLEKFGVVSELRRPPKHYTQFKRLKT